MEVVLGLPDIVITKSKDELGDGLVAPSRSSPVVGGPPLGSRRVADDGVSSVSLRVR